MRTSAAKSFFSKDRNFYKRLFTILLTVSLQNVVAYSVNMADNLMLELIEYDDDHGQLFSGDTFRSRHCESDFLYGSAAIGGHM